MQSALEALSRMATLAKQMGAERIEAVATSAVRDATNGREFLDRVRAETGLRVRTLDGEDEARLTFRSALAHFDLGRRPLGRDGHWRRLDRARAERRRPARPTHLAPVRRHSAD